MLYILDAFHREDEQKAHIIWETSKSFDGTPEICGKLLCFMRPGTKKYTIPEGVATLCFAAFVDEEEDWFECDAVSLELPASLTKIEDSALLFANLRSIRIAPGNSSFVVKKGGLYTADGKRLIYILHKPNCSIFNVAEGTEQIDAGALFWGGTISIPKSVRKICDESIYNSPLLRLHMMHSLPSFEKLLVHKGSYAERFAQRMGFNFEPIDA